MNWLTGLTGPAEEAETPLESDSSLLTTKSKQEVNRGKQGDEGEKLGECDSGLLENDSSPACLPTCLPPVNQKGKQKGKQAELFNDGNLSQFSPPLLTCLPENTHQLKNFSKDKPSVTVEANLEPISPPPQVGDQVLVNGVATWIRNGSDKLPWKQVPKKMRNAAEVPIACLDDQLFHQLMNGGRVLSRSKDGARVKIRNPETGRTSVFPITNVVVLPSGGQTHANEP
ncbi:MAG: hypothetical protein F6K19_45285 [Cyanothece sp. SIO1E1]|nr:hypothetical protein [Cyanothece sp. SIO1E1]